MTDLSKALHNAVSSSLVQICQKLLTFSSCIKITGSITFDVDGQQHLNIVLSEEIAARTNIRSSCDRRTKNADNKNCDDVKGNLTTNKRRRGRTRAKTATVRRSRCKRHNQLSAAAAAAADDDEDNNHHGDSDGDINDDDKTNFPSIAVTRRHALDNVQHKEHSQPTENHLQTLGIPRQPSSDDYPVKVENVKDIVDDQHCAIDLEKPSTCNDVDFTTDRSGRYNKDITVHHHGNSNKPATCQKEFDDWSHHLKKTRSASMMDTIPCPRSDCDETFNTATTLDRHLRDDHDFKQKILSCHSCNFRFIASEQLKEHIEVIHSNTCVTCGKTFADKRILKSHRETVHAKSRLTCSVCGEQCPTQRALQRHVLSCHDGATKPRVSCDECEKTFTSASTLYHHKRAIHGSGKPYKCTQCGAQFNFSHSLKLHVLKHAGRRPHQCQTCFKSYLTASHLKYHVDAIHSTAKHFVCNICHKSFPYKTSYKLHRRLHTGDRPFTCSTCGKSFITRGALREHEKIHASGNSESHRQYQCEECARCYRTAALLRAHQRRHTSDATRHVCEFCGRAFMYRSNLEVHLSVHTSERAFSCTTCGKSFKTTSTLYTHQVVHQSEAVTRHVCTKCGKSFKTKQRLRAHEVRHSGAKPHICRSCGGAFPDRGGLAKHLRTVHAAHARYACPSCRKTANRLDNLRVHMRTHGDQNLMNLTAEELTISAGIDTIFNKQRPVEPSPEVIVPTPLVTVEHATPAPISAFCLLPNKTDIVENHCHLPRFAAATPSSVCGSAGAGAVDLFQDSGAYVQHCLSFVTLPAAEYIPQANVTAQPLSYIHHQP